MPPLLPPFFDHIYGVEFSRSRRVRLGIMKCGKHLTVSHVHAPLLDVVILGLGTSKGQN